MTFPGILGIVGLIGLTFDTTIDGYLQESILVQIYNVSVSGEISGAAGMQQYW